MKKIMHKLAQAAMIGLLVFSCDKILDKQPMGVESAETFFKNEDQAIRSITAIYDATAWYNSQEMNEWVFGDICSDDAEKGGENAADAPQMEQMKHFKADEGISYTTDTWNHSYQGIYRANVAIDGIEKNLSSDLCTRLVGEAKFLRALYYFRLVRLFGDVPLVLHALEREEYCQGRTEVAQVWAQMEIDLKAAAAVLPEKSAYADADMGRATKGAANALLTKAYIFQGKWAEAKATAELVINSTQYDLMSNYADNFTLAGENGKESIYEFQHVTISTGAWADGNEGCVTNIYQGSRANKWYTGWGYVCPTDDFKAEFETDGSGTIIDPRYKATVIEEGDSIYQGTPAAAIAANPASPTKRQNRKYLCPYSDPAPAMSNGPSNWKFMRYSDLLLWHAEACCQSGDAASALVSLNKVRARVDMPAQTETGKDALLKLIYHERRVELGMEGHRFFDIIRTGRGAECLGENGFVEGQHNYFPLPKTELSVCDKLTQNPYY